MNAIEQLKQAKIAISQSLIHLIRAEHSFTSDQRKLKAEALQEYANAIHLLDSVIEELSHEIKQD